MSSTIEEDATRRKRRRNDDDDGDANREEETVEKSGSAALDTTTASPALKALISRLGTRLENAAPVLESQPTSLQDLLIPALREMLSVATNIRQRTETLEKQSHPMTDPKTNTTIKMKKFPDQDLPFIPSSLRKACPIKCSEALKDDPEMIAILDKAASDWEHFAKVRMAMHDRAVKKHEIKKRQENLQKLFNDFASLWAKAIFIGMREEEDLPDGTQLTWQEFASTLAYEALSMFSKASWQALGFATKNAMLKAYKQQSKHSKSSIDAKITDGDKKYYEDSVDVFASYLTGTTIDIWFEDEDKDTSRKINAAIKAELGIEVTATATEEVRTAVAGTTSQSQENRVMDAARKAARAETKKAMQQIITSQRKKSLGNEESQSLSVTKNGQSSNKKSKKSGKKQKQPSSPKQPPKSSMKSKKKKPKAKVKFASDTKGAAKGNQGGAKGGKKKKGARER